MTRGRESNMLERKGIAALVAATAIVAGPMGAVPARAGAEPIPCEVFAPPYDRVCKLIDQGAQTVIDVYCIVFPEQAICD